MKTKLIEIFNKIIRPLVRGLICAELVKFVNKAHLHGRINIKIRDGLLEQIEIFKKKGIL